MKMAGIALDDSRLRDEEELEWRVIKRVVAGETDAYGILAERYQQRIYRLAQHLVQNHMEAEDIVQEAHLRALTYLHHFGGKCRFVTWLARVATNEAFNQLRRRRRREEMSERLALASRMPGFPAARTPDPETCALEKEAREALRKAVATLPPRYRGVFLLRDVGGLALPEVARHLQIRDDNVRVRLHRARRLLRRDISRRLPVLMELRRRPGAVSTNRLKQG
jgi:RNA polymerase sigma-70 factor, ECF subfamily